MRGKQKKIAVINDFSGYGRCSLTVELPIISALKVQCCPIPTSIFSNHTGYKSYFFDDYTDKMELYIQEWKKIGADFDGICTGYLGSHRQIEIVKKFIDEFRDEKTIVIIDPVMGDNGVLYSGFDSDITNEIKKLVKYADIITPNLTESCILADREYKDSWSESELESMAECICESGAGKVVITGIQTEGYIENYCYEHGSGGVIIKSKKMGTPRCGTGDIFTSIIAADAVNDVPFDESVKKASDFVRECIEKSIEYEVPLEDGVCFEEILTTLK